MRGELPTMGIRVRQVYEPRDKIRGVSERERSQGARTPRLSQTLLTTESPAGIPRAYPSSPWRCSRS
jgi:hypothetical protein